jgi:hypothetical protein
MLFLRYYRAESDGWNASQCSTCSNDFREAIRPFSTCAAPAICYTNICRMQPPSLLALAAHTVLNYVFNLERFELTKDMTHQQYQYVVNSNRVTTWRLLPPNISPSRSCSVSTAAPYTNSTAIVLEMGYGMGTFFANLLLRRMLSGLSCLKKISVLVSTLRETPILSTYLFGP